MELCLNLALFGIPRTVIDVFILVEISEHKYVNRLINYFYQNFYSDSSRSSGKQ